MSVPIRIAQSAFRSLVIYLIAIFVIAIVLIDAALISIVIRPVRRLASVADRISSGDTGVSELPVRGTDEISVLTAAFNRMYVSLQKAFQLLND